MTTVICFLYILLISITFAYGIRLFVLRLSLSRLGESQNGTSDFVSVVIAVRNEERNIGDCLKKVFTRTCPAVLLFWIFEFHFLLAVTPPLSFFTRSLGFIPWRCFLVI